MAKPIRSCRCNAASTWCAASAVRRATSCPAWGTTCPRHCSTGSPTASATTPQERAPRGPGKDPDPSPARRATVTWLRRRRASRFGYKHARGSACAATCMLAAGPWGQTPNLEAASMLRLPAPAFEDDARGLIDTRMALRYLWVAVLVCAIGSVASLLQPFEITSAARAVLVGAQVLLGVLCVV